MSEDPEPERNISGSDAGGGRVVTFAPGAAETRAEAVVDHLGDIYWQKAYDGRDAFECLVRTILSQNTADEVSQPAHDALMERYGEGGATGVSATGERAESGADRESTDLAETLAAADQQRLAETIAIAGLHNQKSKRIIALAELVCEEYGGQAGFDEFVKTGDSAEVRSALLEMTGVGPKTADCVLLFAGGHSGVFPVDTHVHRIARRMGLAPPGVDHEAVREHLERDVPAEKCGFGHTAMIQFGRDTCSARTPACLDDPDACPLVDLCDQVGVDTVAGEVADPAEVGED